jgi:hypothetical protein
MIRCIWPGDYKNFWVHVQEVLILKFHNDFMYIYFWVWEWLHRKVFELKRWSMNSKSSGLLVITDTEFVSAAIITPVINYIYTQESASIITPVINYIYTQVSASIITSKVDYCCSYIVKWPLINDLTWSCAFLERVRNPDPITVPTPIIAGITVTMRTVSLGDIVYRVITQPIVWNKSSIFIINTKLTVWNKSSIFIINTKLTVWNKSSIFIINIKLIVWNKSSIFIINIKLTVWNKSSTITEM